MTNMKFRSSNAQRRLCLTAALVSGLAIYGALSAFAQGASPPPAPAAAPPATTTPPGDPAARARAAALAAKANVDVTEAWTRATGNATTAPIYFHIVSVKDPDKLVGVEAVAAARVELRDDTPQATARVMPTPIVDIPGGATVNFGPGGKYLQLVGLKAPLKEGDSFLITLKFDKAGSSSTAVRILGAAATGLPPVGSARSGDTTAGVSQR